MENKYTATFYFAKAGAKYYKDFERKTNIKRSSGGYAWFVARNETTRESRISGF